MNETILVRITDTGSGSKRIVIPKRFMHGILKDAKYVYLWAEADGIHVEPVEMLQSSGVVKK